MDRTILLIILCAPVLAIAIGMLAIGFAFKLDKDMFDEYKD
jgi:hypothetical protein